MFAFKFESSTKRKNEDEAQSKDQKKEFWLFFSVGLVILIDGLVNFRGLLVLGPVHPLRKFKPLNPHHQRMLCAKFG